MEELVLIVWPGRRQKRKLTFLRDVDKHPECHSSEVACVYPWVQCVPAEMSFKLPLGLPEYQCLREQIIALPSRAVLRTEASQKHSVLTELPWGLDNAPQACEHLRSHLHSWKVPRSMWEIQGKISCHLIFQSTDALPPGNPWTFQPSVASLSQMSAASGF